MSSSEENGATESTNASNTNIAESVLKQQLNELQEKYDLQAEQLKMALKRTKEMEEKSKEQGVFN